MNGNNYWAAHILEKSTDAVSDGFQLTLPQGINQTWEIFNLEINTRCKSLNMITTLQYYRLQLYTSESRTSFKEVIFEN